MTCLRLILSVCFLFSLQSEIIVCAADFSFISLQSFRQALSSVFPAYSEPQLLNLFSTDRENPFLRTLSTYSIQLVTIIPIAGNRRHLKSRMVVPALLFLLFVFWIVSLMSSSLLGIKSKTETEILHLSFWKKHNWPPILKLPEKNVSTKFKAKNIPGGKIYQVKIFQVENISGEKQLASDPRSHLPSLLWLCTFHAPQSLFQAT